MKRFAILLATEQYRSYKPTAFCFNDIDRLQSALVECCDFASQDILSRKLDLKFAGTPSSLIDEMKLLLRKAQPGDIVLFYYAGHGAHSNGDSYLILPNTEPGLFNSTAIPLRDISDTFRNPELVNIRLFDSCHSGQDVRGSEVDDLNQEAFTRDILSGSSQGWMTFAACRENEFSHSDLSLQSGVFTYFLSEALRNYSDGELIYPETLKIRVCEKVQDWADTNGRTQTPTFNSSISGNIVLAKKTTRSKHPVTSAATAEPVTGTDPDQQSREIVLDRLAKAREIGIVSTSDLFKTQEKALKGLELYLNGRSFSQLEKLDRAFVVSQVSIDNLKQFQKIAICNAFEDSKLQPRYRISINRTYEEPESGNDFLGMSGILDSLYSFGRKKSRRLVSTDYTLSKNYSEPEGYVEVVAQGDDIVPSFSIWFILVPCLTRIACCYGYRIGFDSDDRQVDSFRAVPFIIPSTDPIDWASVLETLLQSLESKLYSSLISSVEKRLDYFELENKELYGK